METTLVLGNISLTINATVDTTCAVVYVTVGASKDGALLASFSAIDIDRKVRPENRAAVRAACDAVLAVAKASPQYAARIAAQDAATKLDADYQRGYNRTMSAMNP